MKHPDVFLVDIAPIVPLPYGKSEVFSYLSKESVPLGSLVLVPFGPRLVRGVSFSCTKLPKETFSGITLKYIRSILEPAFLTEKQLALARIISDECLTPLGRTLRHFLPDRVNERMKSEVPDQKHTSLHLSKAEMLAARETLASPIPCFATGTWDEILRITASVIKKAPRSSQTLVLVPEHISIPQTLEFLIGIFGSGSVSELSSAIPKGALFSVWERIRSGESKVIVGTRQALFAPWKKLSLVVILEESEMLGYKQWDMSPRYDARHIAEILSQLHDSRILYADTGKTLEIQERIRNGSIVSVFGKSVPKEPHPEIVNMREERFKKNFSLLSSTLSARITETLTRKGLVILIASRSGLDSFLVCESCKTVPRCPECDRALRSSKEGFFRCPSCSFRTKEFPKCSACGGLSFKSIGGGTERIERETKKSHPNANIVRMDEQTLKQANSFGSLRERMLSADIVIGTPSLLHIGELPKAGLIAIMDAENFLSFPDFRTDERFLGVMDSAHRILQNRTGSRILVQTFHPEREIFRRIGARTEHELIEQSLQDREALRYPPFFSLFRVGFHDRSLERTEELSQEAFKKLSRAAKALENIRVSPPRTPLTQKTRGKYEKFIIITAPSGQPFPDTLRDTLISLPKGWTFDPNPLSLI